MATSRWNTNFSTGPAISRLYAAMGSSDIEKLADRLIEAHSATVDWLTTVLAEDALGGPAALQRTPLQTATGVAVRLVNVPMCWSARGLDRAVDTVRSAPPALGELLSRGAHAGDVAAKALTASRDAAPATAARSPGAKEPVRPPMHCIRCAAPPEYSQPTSCRSPTTTLSDVRAILAYEEAHKNRQGVVSAAPDTRRGHRTRGRRHRLSALARSPVPNLDIPAVTGDRGDIAVKFVRGCVDTHPADTVSTPAVRVIDRSSTVAC